MSSKKKKSAGASKPSADTNKRRATGLARVINSIGVARKRINAVSTKLTAWGLENDDTSALLESIDSVIEGLQSKQASGWEPPRRAALSVEEGSTVKVAPNVRSTYTDSFNVGVSDLDSLEVVKISKIGKREKIIVRVPDSDVQFPVSKRHISVVAG